MLSKSSKIGNALSITIFCIFAIGKITLIHSQSDDSSKKNYYQWFDSATGLENSGLYNGIVYAEKYRMLRKKQKFFHSTDFLQGSIVYDERPYFDVAMKYDVNEDEVLIKLGRVLLLEKGKIKNFTINGHQFEKFDYRDHGNSNINGFVEVLFKNYFFSFIKKHKKEAREKLGKKLVFHEFFDKNQYFLFYQNQYHRISSRRDIVKVFPDFAEKIIKRFPKSRRKAKKEDYLNMVLNGIDQMMLEEKTKTIE